MDHDSRTTIVQNILDDRLYVFSLPAEKAVVAACELFDRQSCRANYQDPLKHPDFREHKRGFSCGDWIAFKQADEDDVDEVV
jgi:hypothetical protein